MINTRELKAQMVRQGLNLRTLAVKMGRSESFVSRLMSSAKCDTDTAEQLIEILQIDNPAPVFFAKKSTCEVREVEA